MSAITQVLLIRFWQNFKRSFLGSSLTINNGQSDNCPGNICLGDICPTLSNTEMIWTKIQSKVSGTIFADHNGSSHIGIGPGKCCPVFRWEIILVKKFETQIFVDPRFIMED